MSKQPKEKVDVSLRSFDEGQDLESATKNRKKFIEDEVDVNLDTLKHNAIRPVDVIGKNIENFVGEVSLPLGIAGPVTVNGAFASGQYYIPCATTEGALTASISRGCKVLSSSGGVKTSVDYKGISRAPLFEVTSKADIKAVESSIQELFSSLSQVAATTSSHLRLMELDITTLGRYLWVRLSYDTQEAMGMNMATIATEKICERIEKQTPGCTLISLSGNMCVDKKANWLNVIKGRGYDVTAECWLPESVIAEHLRTTSKEIAKICRTKNWYGSAMSGSVAFNAQAANVISAVFLATGQDIAHTIESSQAFTIAEETDGGLYIATKIPNVIAGSIGGGTWLPAQKAAMNVMITAVGKSDEKPKSETHCFAEVLAAGVLAGELSLLGALSTNTLASAHRKHARNGDK